MSSRIEKNRYMDTMTIRPRNGRFTKNQNMVHDLLVEPVILPDLEHLSVDESLEVHENCVFYPTGYKNVNMRNTMEEMVRKVNARTELTKFQKTDAALTKPPPNRPYDETMPTHPLCYTRTRNNKGANNEIKKMLTKKYLNERALRSTITPEF